MPNQRPAFIIRATHTGLLPGGRTNTKAVLIPDLEVGYEYQHRKNPVYVPVGGFIDILGDSKTLFSYEKGAIRKYITAGILTARFFVEPETYANATRPLATLYPAGTGIWNTDDNAFNYSDGTNWRDALGNLT